MLGASQKSRGGHGQTSGAKKFSRLRRIFASGFDCTIGMCHVCVELVKNCRCKQNLQQTHPAITWLRRAWIAHGMASNVFTSFGEWSKRCWLHPVHGTPAQYPLQVAHGEGHEEMCQELCENGGSAMDVLCVGFWQATRAFSMFWRKQPVA